MKTDVPLIRFHPLAVGALLCAALLSLARAQAPVPPAAKGPAQTPAAPSALAAPAGPKVRVMVTENNGAVLAGGSGGAAAATPAPKKATPAAAGGKPPGPAQLPGVDEAKEYTRTTKKSLLVDVVNLTATPMDLTVKSTFMAKDEAGKHEVIPETTVENKLSIPAGKSQRFTTAEVAFTHTAAHRGVPPKPAGGSSSKGKGAIAPMEPASGHAYFGYKVEVFQGSDLVGSAISDNQVR